MLHRSNQRQRSKTDKIIEDTAKYLKLHNNTLLQTMEEVFAENMQLMENVKDTFDIEEKAKESIQKILARDITSKILRDMSSSTEIQGAAQSIIESLIQRQKNLIQSFKATMDKDLKLKSKDSNEMMENLENEGRGRRGRSIYQ